MKFSVKDFFSKCDQIRRKLRIWSHLLKKSLMENCIFCAVFLIIDFFVFDMGIHHPMISWDENTWVINSSPLQHLFWHYISHKIYLFGKYSFAICPIIIR